MNNAHNGCGQYMTSESGHVYRCEMADCNDRNHYWVRELIPVKADDA